MSNSKFLVVGIVIGVLLGAGAFYVLNSFNPVSSQLAAKDSQIIELQNQIIGLQSQLQQQQSNQVNETLAQQLLDLGSSFTKYEKLEFAEAYVDQSSDGATIHLDFMNGGTADATLDLAQTLVNGRPTTSYSPQLACSFSQLTLSPGQTATGTITLPNGSDGVSGMNIEVMLHTVGGKDYPKVVTLP
jgi:archaeal type IV pilus assembly protein PilA